MARLLAEAGRAPEHLALLDVRPPKGSLTRFESLLRKASTLIALFIPLFHDRTLGQALRDRFRKSRSPPTVRRCRAASPSTTTTGGAGTTGGSPTSGPASGCR